MQIILELLRLDEKLGPTSFFSIVSKIGDYITIQGTFDGEVSSTRLHNYFLNLPSLQKSHSQTITSRKQHFYYRLINLSEPKHVSNEKNLGLT